MKAKEKLTIVFLILIAWIVASLPLFGNTLFSVPVQDTFFHTQRIWSVKNALEEGQFPVRIYSEIYDGYGYGASLFYPDLFLYFPAVLCMLGLPLVVSYNIFLITINLITIVVAYYSFSKLLESKALGTIAAILYTLSTYRLLDMYTRGAMGEVLALIFCPLALCGLVLIKRGAYHKWWVLTIAYTGLLQSHIISFTLMALFAIVFAVINFRFYKNLNVVKAVSKSVFVFLLINAWFIVPFIQVSRMNVIAFLGTDSFWVTDASFIQLFDILHLSACGHEVYTEGIAESMPKTPGAFLIIGTIFAIFALILFSDKFSREKRRHIWCYVISGFISTLMITNFFPWTLFEKITIFRKFFEKFQFMWRFNIFSILFLSIAAAYGFYFFFLKDADDKIYIEDTLPSNTANIKSMIFISIAACVFAMSFLNQFVKQAAQYGNEQVVENGFMDRMYVVPGFPYDTNGEINSNLKYINYSDVQPGSLSFFCDYKCNSLEVINEEAPYIEVPLAYYPGYKAYIDDEQVKTECSIWGLVRVYLSENNMEGHLYVIYEEDVLVIVANTISIITLLALCIYILVKTKGKKKKCELILN